MYNIYINVMSNLLSKKNEMQSNRFCQSADELTYHNRYNLYNVHTAHVMYCPFLYGGQGREPQTAVTGYKMWPFWSCCRAPSVRYSESSWRQTKSKAYQPLSSLSVTKNPWYCMFQPLGHMFFAGIIKTDVELSTWHTAHGMSSSQAIFR